PALKLADLLEGEVVVPFDFQEIAAELAAFDPKDDEDREIIDLCYRRHLALIVNGFADSGRRTDLVRACDVAAAVTVDLTGPRLAAALRRDDRFGNYRHDRLLDLAATAIGARIDLADFTDVVWRRCRSGRCLLPGSRHFRWSTTARRCTRSKTAGTVSKAT